MKKNDKEFDDYLNGKSELSEHYRASNTAEPPADLDKQILLAAKQAVSNTEKKRVVRFHQSRWALPVSIAAVITLSVSLVITMQQETGQKLIGEPRLDFHEVEALAEEPLPQASSADSAVLSVDTIESKSGQRARAVDDAVGAMESNEYRTKSDSQIFKDEASRQATKKITAKEQVRAETAKQKTLETQSVLPAAPAEIAADMAAPSSVLHKNFSVEQQLLEIKKYLIDGNMTAAIKLFNSFMQQYPDFNEAEIKKILGPDRYDVLTNASAEPE